MDRFINQNKDISFQQKACELYKRYLLYRNYQDYVTKNISMGNYILSWDDYKILVHKPKTLTLDLSIVSIINLVAQITMCS